jgi:glucose/mannose transport system substrate-binding protein
VTVNGHVYAMPSDVHRENALFYNKQIFAALGLQPPTTTGELLSVCAALKAGGVTPIAVVNQGWILRILFNSLAMGQMGSTAFHDFMAGGPRDDAALMAAIDLFENVLTNYVNTNAGDSTLGWTDAASMMTSGHAGMFLHGDWAKGYYTQLGQPAGVDFGVVGAPGAADMFWYDLDTFAMPQGSPDPSGAMDFLTTIASVGGQVAFNRLKGSSPVRTDVPLAQFDSEARATLQDLQDANYRMAVVNYDAWDNAFAAFAVSFDKNALFQVYVDTPPVH